MVFVTVTLKGKPTDPAVMEAGPTTPSSSSVPVASSPVAVLFAGLLASTSTLAPMRRAAFATLEALASPL